MKLEELMQNRRSTRQYKPTSVSIEKLKQILETAGYAPSGANRQPWVYILITDQKLKREIRKQSEKIEKTYHQKLPKASRLKTWLKKHQITYQKPFLTQAPALIVAAGDKRAPYWLESTWISITYILLAAENQKLATLTYTPPHTEFLNQLLHIPSNYKPVAIIPVGHPSKTRKQRKRKPLNRIVYHNQYGQSLESTKCY